MNPEVARARDAGDPPSSCGVRILEGGAEFAVFSRHAERIFVCLFDERGEREIARWRLADRAGDIHHGFIPSVKIGARYGLRADGPDEPARGHRFDPAKLLIDPMATRLDRPVQWRPELAAPRTAAIDTAPFMPRAIIEDSAETSGFRSRPATFILEVNIRAHTMRHPDVPIALRGSIGGLSSPRVLEHFSRLGVSHVELMPITAAMTERHLVECGLRNAWGYNPASFIAPDPLLAPGGLADLGAFVRACRGFDIGVILDVVFNHTAESDALGPTLSLRGLDNASYYRLRAGDPGKYADDTGCGNSLACDRAPVVDLITASLRRFADCGIDGFRFDLAATLARDDNGFPSRHPLFEAIAADARLSDRILVAEPWDIGPGGYRLGAFPGSWLEWNDRYRDRVRRFWRGDACTIGEFATALSGSSDVYGQSRTAPSASVNFIAAHDGFTLHDLVAYRQKHNDANGENNRDGADESYSWNCGVEGNADDPAIDAARTRDLRALLGCLFVSRGTLMLTAGDEMGRTQRGNNNAYAQDNETTWLDWEGADTALADYVAQLATLRRALKPLRADAFLDGASRDGIQPPDVVWLNPDGSTRNDADWRDGDILSFSLFEKAEDKSRGERVFIVVNRGFAAANVIAPPPRDRHVWTMALDSSTAFVDTRAEVLAPIAQTMTIPERCVVVLVERRIN